MDEQNYEYYMNETKIREINQAFDIGIRHILNSKNNSDKLIIFFTTGFVWIINKDDNNNFNLQKKRNGILIFNKKTDAFTDCLPRVDAYFTINLISLEINDNTYELYPVVHQDLGKKKIKNGRNKKRNKSSKKKSNKKNKKRIRNI